MIKPKKSLGQNFLIDKNISNKIVDSLQISPDDLVLEIGPGTGALTSLLAKFKVQIVAVDTDKRAVELLKSKFPESEYQNLRIIHSDIREINIRELLTTYSKQRLKVIGNIPYNISADISFWMFESATWIDSCVMMFQKEVAKRIIAKPKSKDYGILTLAMQMTGEAKILFDVSPNCFYPKPEVTSSVVFMNFADDQLSTIDYKRVLKLVKTSFNQRRKTLRNALKLYLLNDLQLNVDQFIENSDENIKKLFTSRAEELDLKDYIRLNEFLQVGKEDSLLS